MIRSMFEIGEKVKWLSQSSGRVTRKDGTVVMTARDAAGLISLGPRRFAESRFPGHRLMFDTDTWRPNGVLVEVEPKSPGAKPLLYCPRPETLRRERDELSPIGAEETMRLKLNEHERLHRELAAILGHDAPAPSLCDLVASARLVVATRDGLQHQVEALTTQVETLRQQVEKGDQE